MLSGDGGRAVARALFTPPAKLLVRLGVSADAVTITGTALSMAAALTLFPLGYLWQGAVVLGALVCTDALDGTMARMTGKSSKWGAFLDSTLDRLADAAVFGGIAIYFINTADRLGAISALAALAIGAVVPYARARAESLGLKASGGLAERSDRLVISLVATFISGVGVTMWVLRVAMILIAVMSAITVGQRANAVRVQGR